MGFWPLSWWRTLYRPAHLSQCGPVPFAPPPPIDVAFVVPVNINQIKVLFFLSRSTELTKWNIIKNASYECHILLAGWLPGSMLTRWLCVVGNGAMVQPDSTCLWIRHAQYIGDRGRISQCTNRCSRE